MSPNSDVVQKDSLALGSATVVEGAAALSADLAWRTAHMTLTLVCHLYTLYEIVAGVPVFLAPGLRAACDDIYGCG